MFTTSQRRSRTALLPILGLLFLLSTMGQTEASTDDLQSAPATTNSSMSIHRNSSMEMKSHRPCGSKYNESFCANNGKCIIYQDRSEPSCQCQLPFGGDRCMTVTSFSTKFNESEKLIGIIIGVIMIVFALVIIVYCCFFKRCMSAPLKTSSPETPV